MTYWAASSVLATEIRYATQYYLEQKEIIVI